MPGRGQNGVWRDLSDPIGPSRFLAPLLPVDVPQKNRRALVRRKCVGRSDRTAEAGGPELFGTRLAVFPSSLSVKEELSLIRLPSRDQLPGPGEVRGARGSPVVFVRKRFGQSLKQVGDVGPWQEGGLELSR